MNKQLDTVFAVIVGLGVCTGVATSTLSPYAFSSALAATGGALAGAAAVNERKREEDRRMQESMRVASAFKGLYEKNQGLINVQQLSIDAGIEYDKAHRFVQTLCEQQKGNQITTDGGDVFNFPHPANVLDKLTKNAQAWVKSQTDPVLQENASLKAELARIQLAGMIPGQSPAPANPAGSLNNPKESKDPWNNLL